MSNRQPDSEATAGHRPRCSVVVATRNRSTKLGALIESVLAGRRHDIELVVVDQSDDDLSEQIVRGFEADPRLRYVRSVERGTSRGRNLGVALTTAEFVAITDDDCVVPADWVDTIIEPFVVDPQVGIVFCNVDPVETDALGLTPSITFDANRTLRSPREGWAAIRSHFVLGAGMAVRRTAFDDVQGFDDLLGPGSTFPACEDNDLLWRVLARGWSASLTTETTVLHDGFRPLDEVRELVRRDCLGAGGASAKYLRAGRWGVLGVLVPMLYRLGVKGPLADLRAGRRPRGLGRPVWVLQGVARGFVTPFERRTLTYRAASPGSRSGPSGDRPTGRSAPRS